MALLVVTSFDTYKKIVNIELKKFAIKFDTEVTQLVLCEI